MESHRLFNNLDAPVRILFWTVDEMGIILLFLFGGLVGECPFTAGMFGYFFYRAFKKLKKKMGRFQAFFYWYCPMSEGLPPSALRVFKG